MVDLKYSDLAGDLDSREPFPPTFFIVAKDVLHKICRKAFVEEIL